MFPYGRLARVIATARLRSRLAPLEPSVVRFRVWPGDLDQNRHLNNGRYLTLMDLGRWDLMARMGMIGKLASRRWFPVVGAATMRYRRSLDPFQAFDLRTRILGWDETAFYLEQTFEREGALIASGAIRGVFLGREGRVAPQAVVDLAAPGTASPEIPEWIHLWQRSLDAARG